MFKDKISKKNYKYINESLENLNKEYLERINSREYRIGSFFSKLFKTLKNMHFSSMIGYLRNIKWKFKKIDSIPQKKDVGINDFSEDDYFSDDKIAVYTCIFGKYDKLQEPLINPDNIDYYVITDQKIPEDSLWNPIDWRIHCDKSLSDVEKNRFFKMKPDILFPDYKYSIYIDGNIKVISDLTPYLKRLNKFGFSMHTHSERDCAYEELKAILLTYKANKDDVSTYYKYLLDNNLPRHYGLCECNVILRENHNLMCKKIMDQWWLEFHKNFKRDQVSLPLILYRNNINIDDIALLGLNVYKNYSFRVVKHI